MLAENEDCRVEAKPLPGMLGVTAVRIVGHSADRVQTEITKVFTQITEQGGVAEFRNPKRVRDLWEATGYFFKDLE